MDWFQPSMPPLPLPLPLALPLALALALALALPPRLPLPLLLVPNSFSRQCGCQITPTLQILSMSNYDKPRLPPLQDSLAPRRTLEKNHGLARAEIEKGSTSIEQE